MHYNLMDSVPPSTPMTIGNDDDALELNVIFINKKDSNNCAAADVTFVLFLMLFLVNIFCEKIRCCLCMSTDGAQAIHF